MDYGSCCTGELCRHHNLIVSYCHKCIRCKLYCHATCGTLDLNDNILCFRCDPSPIHLVSNTPPGGKVTVGHKKISPHLPFTDEVDETVPKLQTERAMLKKLYTILCAE
jgi:hypothetical protein